MARGFSAYPRLSYSKRDFAWEWECYVYQKKQAKKAIEEQELVEEQEVVEVDKCNIGDVDYLKDDEGYVYDIKTDDTVGKFDFNLDVWLFIYRPKELEVGKIQKYYVEW